MLAAMLKDLTELNRLQYNKVTRLGYNFNGKAKYYCFLFLLFKVALSRRRAANHVFVPSSKRLPKYTATATRTTTSRTRSLRPQRRADTAHPTNAQAKYVCLETNRVHTVYPLMCWRYQTQFIIHFYFIKMDILINGGFDFILVGCGCLKSG